MRASIYIYYRVRADHTLPAEAAARAIISAVADHCSSAGRLLQKIDDPLVWMEVYDEVADAEALSRALTDAATESGIERHLEAGSSRHVEKFTSLCV